MSEVRIRENESLESALKRFKRQCAFPSRPGRVFLYPGKHKNRKVRKGPILIFVVEISIYIWYNLTNS